MPDIAISLKLKRWCFQYLGILLPAIMGRWAYQLWITTKRYPYPEREKAYLKTAKRLHLDYKGHQIAVYCWGQGPTILLVHGWNGRGTQLGAFIKPLLDAGYQVVAFDAPGHGHSSGGQSNIFLFVASMQTVLKQIGHCHAIICHSFGVPCTLKVLSTQKSADCVIAIGAPSTTEGLIYHFSQYLQLAKPAYQSLKHYTERLFGDDIWQQTSALYLAKKMTVPGLIIHDRQDKDVPYQESEKIQANWPNAELWLTEKLGHRRILRSQKVFTRSIQFIQNIQH